MSDPQRWNQGGAGATSRGTELLRTAARPRVMTSAERARTSARVARLAAVPGIGTALAMGLKGLGVVLGIGVLGLAARGVVHESSRDAAAIARPLLMHLPAERLHAAIHDVTSLMEAPAESPAPPAAMGEASPYPAAQPVSIDAPARQAPRSRAPSKPIEPEGLPSSQPAAPAAREASAPTEDQLLREAMHVEQARAALARDPKASLSALDEARAEFPEGQLAAERELLAIDALMRLGRADEAQRRAQAFLARFPASPYAERMRQAIRRTPGTTGPQATPNPGPAGRAH